MNEVKIYFKFYQLLFTDELVFTPKNVEWFFKLLVVFYDLWKLWKEKVIFVLIVHRIKYIEHELLGSSTLH